MNKNLITLLLVVFLTGLAFNPTQAAAPHQEEEPELVLRMSRDFGYGGMGDDIQGLFTIYVEERSDLQRVTFFMDGEVFFDDTEAPFRFQFTTDDYPLGQHVLTAVGYTTDGRELAAREIGAEFVSAEEGNQAALKIVLPLLLVVGGISLLGILIPVIASRGKPGQALPLGAPRNYGILGGTICPKCSRPFALHMWSINVSFAGKYDRCPHCGKWSFVRRAAPELLAQAEAAELAEAQRGQMQEISEEERLRKELDNSRFSE